MISGYATTLNQRYSSLLPFFIAANVSFLVANSLAVPIGKPRDEKQTHEKEKEKNVQRAIPDARLVPGF